MSDTATPTPAKLVDNACDADVSSLGNRLSMKLAMPIILVLLIVAPSGAAPPATAPVGRVVRVNGRLARTQGTYHWSDLIRFELRGGKLRVDPAPAEELRKMLSSRPVVLQIEGSPDPWLVTAEPFAGSANRPPGWTLSAATQKLPGPDLDDYRPRIILATPDHFHVIGQGIVDGRMMRAEFYLIELERAQVTLVDQTASNKPPTILRAANLAQMLSQHPLEMRRYVSPLLDVIAGHRVLKPGEADVYRAFDSIPADESVAEQVGPIITELGAPNSARRDGASAKLEALGAPAVLAVLRMDRSGFSPEQKSRVDRFLAAHTIGLDPQAARRDVNFLTDSLCDEDRRVRAAAKETLSVATGKKIDFDIDQDSDARLAAATKLAEELMQSQP